MHAFKTLIRWALTVWHIDGVIVVTLRLLYNYVVVVYALRIVNITVHQHDSSSAHPWSVLCQYIGSDALHLVQALLCQNAISHLTACTLTMPVGRNTCSAHQQHLAAALHCRGLYIRTQHQIMRFAKYLTWWLRCSYRYCHLVGSLFRIEEGHMARLFNGLINRAIITCWRCVPIVWSLPSQHPTCCIDCASKQQEQAADRHAQPAHCASILHKQQSCLQQLCWCSRPGSGTHVVCASLKPCCMNNKSSNGNGHQLANDMLTLHKTSAPMSLCWL